MARYIRKDKNRLKLIKSLNNSNIYNKLESNKKSQKKRNWKKKNQINKERKEQKMRNKSDQKINYYLNKKKK